MKYPTGSVVVINRTPNETHSRSAPNGLYIIVSTESNMLGRDADGNAITTYELLAVQDYVNNVWDAPLYYVIESELSEPPPLARALFRKN